MSESLISIEEFTRRAIGVPFVDRGHDYSGWDCWNLLCLFHREVLGISIPSYAEGYSDAGHSAESRRVLTDLFQKGMASWRRVESPEPGDVVLLNIGGRPLHVGLAIGGGLMLHTERQINTVIERLASPMWARRIEGFYRYAG